MARTTNKSAEPPKRSAKQAPRNTPNLAMPIGHRTAKDEFRRRGMMVVAITLIIVGAVFVLYPFVPIIRYAIAKPQPYIPYESNFSEDTTTATVVSDDPTMAGETIAINPGTLKKAAPGKTRPRPVTNRLVIPKIGVDEAVVEGTNEDVALNQGIWRIPTTSSPDKGSNTVLSGHRFRFLSGNRTLYLLDKVQKGDPIIVYWKGKEYNYVVRGLVIVKPTHVSILDPTKNPRLTIFTCSPLFSTKERLVLIADLVRS